MDNLGRDIGNMIGCMMCALVISVPLGMWKLLDILWWVWTHVSVSW